VSLHPRRHPALPPGLAERLDPVCDRFEAEWLAGRPPRLEDFLPLADEADRPALLGELLALDLDYRSRGGERPAVDDYRRRLPEYAGVAEAVFAALAPTGRVAPAPPTPIGAEAPARPAAPAVPGPAALVRAGRYEIEGEIARGGMGTVLRARDPDLNRALAVKVLRADCLTLPGVERRFREEAQITGQLQHPGIPPVHEVGTLPDGRPFFAMKLIRGRTLAELLQERPARSDDLPRFLAIFEQVCQTLAYAHSRGIIHRDLKPLNVMVGAFGEVQVMDWGLAKVLSGESAGGGRFEEGSSIATVRTASPGLSSQAGTVLGTPAYMAPEQARGEVDRLDERCDVFGLGAILCAMLTGQPPYQGANGGELLARAARGDLAEAQARLDACGVDGELVRLARWRLAPEKDGRPRDAGAVAQAVGAYRAGVQERLREAERQRAAAEARAVEQRRRRRWQLALAVSVFATLLLAGATAAWFARERWENERRVRAAYAEAVRLQGEARAASGGGVELVKWAEAEAAGRTTENLLGQGVPGELAEQVRRLNETLGREAEAARRAAEVRRKDERMLQALDRAAQAGVMGEWRNPNPGFGRDDLYTRAFHDYGLDLADPSLSEQESLAAIRGSAIRQDLISGLDAWAVLLRWWKVPAPGPELSARVLRLARAADDAGSLSCRVRNAYENRDKAALRRLLDDEGLAALPTGSLQMLLGELYQPDGSDELRPLLRRAVTRRPDDFWLNYSLALELTYHRPPRPAEAVGYFRVASALRPTVAVVRMHHVNALLDLGQAEEAIAVARKGTELATKSEDGLGQYYLAKAYAANKQWDEAIRNYREAVRRGRGAGWDGWSRPRLREAVRQLGSPAEARRLVEEDPNSAESLRTLSEVLEAHGNSREAGAAARMAVEAYRKALERKPDDWQTRKDLAALLLRQRRPQEAVAVAEEAPTVRPHLPDLYTTIGLGLQSIGEHDRAIRAWRRALELNKDFGMARAALCNTLVGIGRLNEAIEVGRQAVASNPRDPDGLRDKGRALAALCQALVEKGRLDEAIGAGRRAIELDPEDPNAFRNLGRALREKGQVDEALAFLRRATELAPNAGLCYLSLGLALRKKGMLDEAVGAYRKAARVEPTIPGRWLDVGVFLAERRQHPEAATAFQEVLKLAPDHAEALCRLGLALREEGRFMESRDTLRRGHALGSKRPGWTLPSAEWLREGERLAEVDRTLPSLLKGERRPRDSGELMEAARFCTQRKGLFAATAELFRSAFAASPGLVESTDTAAPDRPLYYVAGVAAATAAGHPDAQPVGPEERARWRRQALAWLRQDLKFWEKQAGKGRETQTRCGRPWAGGRPIPGWPGSATAAPWKNSPPKSARPGTSCGRTSPG
jgi:serine/threonine-protein kinase